MGFVYLLHFDKPYKHAKHYLGFSVKHPEKDRIPLHSKGQSRVKLMTVLFNQGIGFQVAKIWKNKERGDERKMKSGGHARRCPICKQNKEVGKLIKHLLEPCQ